MAEAKSTKLRIKAGSFEVEFEGTEGFLRSDVPKLIKSVNELQSSEIGLAANLLKKDLEDSVSLKTELDPGDGNYQVHDRFHERNGRDGQPATSDGYRSNEQDDVDLI